MTSDDHDAERSDAGGSGFVRTVLSGLFETIADMDERDQRRRSATGSGRSGSTRFDYGLDVGIGPGRDESQSRDPEVETDYAASVNPTDEGCIVTLDLPDVDPRDLAAGVDSSGETLVVGTDSVILERVSLPRGDLAVADASFNNGVLDVRLVAEGAA
ncbi:gas vesicle protein GvpH [Halococcus sp. IIIV-5B]|uniref:gas vesicle protein GvpH n=1 Tax=Halococcus sp. IIIV-5B TaxID=2321230 RepID=UPI000E76A3DC|nr:gas vesicle protein GvpH [Halococcus sp. IIIV-5B]RJS97105.1 hypothetical protein D3261_18385 [Halococcus sp. IIIV-5B]